MSQLVRSVEVLWVTLCFVGLVYGTKNFIAAWFAWSVVRADADDTGLFEMTHAVVRRISVRGAIFLTWFCLGLVATVEPGGTILRWPPDYPTMSAVVFLLTLAGLVLNEVAESRTTAWCHQQWKLIDADASSKITPEARKRRARVGG